MEFELSAASAEKVQGNKYQQIDLSETPDVVPERRKRVLIIAGWLTFAVMVMFIALSSSSGSSQSTQKDAEFLRSSHQGDIDTDSHHHHKKTVMPTVQPTNVPQPPWVNWIPAPYRPEVPGEPSLPPTNSPPWTQFVPAPYQPVDPQHIASGSPPWAIFIPEPYNPFLSTPTMDPSAAPTVTATDKPHHRDHEDDKDRKKHKPKH